MAEKPTTAVDEMSLYQQVGGEAGVKALVERFYQIMDSDPAAQAVRAVHGASLVSASQKLEDFLSGWLGGPPLYLMKHGQPRMRMRHLPFAIGPAERAGWLHCMKRALEECRVPLDAQHAMWAGFKALAEKIQNQE